MERWKTMGRPISISFALAFTAWSDSNPETNATSQPKEEGHEPGAAREIGAGAGALGTGATKGARGRQVNALPKGAAELVTLPSR
jgi:hypothetical protein